MTIGEYLTNIIKRNGDIDKKYMIWQKEVRNIMEKCFYKKRKNKKQNNERIKYLYRLKRKIKKGYLTEPTTLTNIKKYRVQNNLIKEYIQKEEAKIRANNIDNEIAKIENDGGLNSTAFWEFKKRMDKKGKQKEMVCGMMNKEGKIVNSKEDIKTIYKDFYTELFSVNEGNSDATKNDEIIFNTINIIAKTSNAINGGENNEITEREIVNNIKKLKNKPTTDIQGWSNELLKNSGTDISKSINIILNEIGQQQIIPIEWEELIVKSIYKNKGNRNDIENRRGLFITSIISKLYEKIKLARNEENINKGISKYQCGGSKGKSTVDHIMTLNEIISYNKYLNKETYIIFADAYKCFDKLNLKNCIIDLYRIVGAVEAMSIYRLNKNGNATINTPCGNVGPIKADHIVRQGTILGPKLCCINTDRVNSIGRKCITNIGPNIKLEMLTYVDDINYANSNFEQIKKAVENLRCMEIFKGFTFKTGKK